MPIVVPGPPGPVPLVTVSDLASWLGVTIALDDARALAILRAASALVRSETGRTWIVDGDLTDVPGDIAGVVVQVAGRVWANIPTGVVQWNKGPFGERILDAVALGMFLSESEKAVLGRYRSGGRQGLYTISTTRGDAAADTVYVPTGPPPAGYPFPWYDAKDSA